MDGVVFRVRDPIDIVIALELYVALLGARLVDGSIASSICAEVNAFHDVLDILDSLLGLALVVTPRTDLLLFGQYNCPLRMSQLVACSIQDSQKGVLRNLLLRLYRQIEHDGQSHVPYRD